MFDNGAFSTWRRGNKFDEEGFIEWVRPILSHPHWAVVPDVIEGGESENDAMLERWQLGKEFGAPVWHLHESIPRLIHLSETWQKVCLGSSGAYAVIGTPAWCNRMDKAFNALAARHAVMPWIHGLRMLGQIGFDWPLASADSTNVAQNFKTYATRCAECEAQRIDATQGRSQWNIRATQKELMI
jgi:hypothetical protein